MNSISHGWKFWLLIALAILVAVVDVFKQIIDEYLNYKGTP
jgi:hypothetical protein